MCIKRNARKRNQAPPKKQRQEIKTVRVGFKTGAHDAQFKANQVAQFLKDGNIVKVELTLRGREKGVAYLGKQKLENFLSQIQEEFTIQDIPRRGPYGWITTIAKKK